MANIIAAYPDMIIGFIALFVLIGMNILVSNGSH